MIAQVQEENGNKVAIPISGSIPTGLPVGTWISFEKDQAPDNKWIKAGETFDENLYPALYLFLGTNKVPERFDHSRLSAYEAITVSTNSANPTVMQYDGLLSLSIRENQNTVGSVYVNEVEIARFYVTSSLASQHVVIPFNKGDSIYITSNATFLTSNVAYYKHPMFIKATSAIEITDQNTFLNTVQSLVQISNSYSTEETATGGFWIDGKPIYRKAGFYAGNIGTSETLLDSLLTNTYIDRLIDGSASFSDSADDKHLAGTYAYSSMPRISLKSKSGGLYTMARTSDTRKDIAWWIEYTKN